MSAEAVTSTKPLVVWGDEVTDTSPGTLGGKGAGLCRMRARKLPVPPFFVVTTRAWAAWRSLRHLDPGLRAEIAGGVRWLEEQTGRPFGDGPDPLLVSVRSSGPVSMPGMMDTVLNLGLTPASLSGLLKRSGDLRFVSDSMSTYLSSTGSSGRGDPDASNQLANAIEQIFASWDNERAVLYRKLSGIPDDLGTAVVVQAMVFGNLDETSGTGVFFTRDAVTGAAVPSGEWVAGAQGEAVVAGRVNPDGLDALNDAHPDAYDELLAIGQILEWDDRHPQDIEFTVESGRLSILQTRKLRLSPLATCRVTVELLEGEAISSDEAAARLSELDLSRVAVERVNAAGGAAIAAGVSAAPGVARGTVVRDVREAIRKAESGEAVVLVRPETSPNDLGGMRVAAAIVTERGGATSHAAIVARDLRVPCVVGCGSLDQLLDGALITVDGTSGRVYDGDRPSERELPEFLETAMRLCRSAMPGETTGGHPAEPAPTDLLDQLLHLALKGLVATEEIGAGNVEPLLAQGWAKEDDGFVFLTEAGDRHLTTLCRELIHAEGHADLEAFFALFEGLDIRLKRIATQWQEVRDQDDPDRLILVLEGWFELDDELAALVEEHPASAALLRRQVGALRAARRRFEAGDTHSFTGVGEDSYHSVWYVTHELLLRTLGKAREG